jgi:predicted membrane protein
MFECSKQSSLPRLYFDASGVIHGLVRAQNGTITTFDAPGAVQGTYTAGINQAGEIVGGYVGAMGVGHGYVRASDGTITSFDVPGAGAAGTQPNNINSGGVTVGPYVDANFALHGFAR